MLEPRIVVTSVAARGPPLPFSGWRHAPLPRCVCIRGNQRKHFTPLHAAGNVQASGIAKVLIVGAGATGACMAYRLRQILDQSIRICLWEKARGPGGRMSTNRQDFPDGRLRADMGAQYLSFDANDSACVEMATMLTENGVCQAAPHDSMSKTPERQHGRTWQHLAGVHGGVNDALKKILDESGAALEFQKRVARIDEDGGQWRVEPFARRGKPKAAAEFFDGVALAVPGRGPGGDNLNKINGSWKAKLKVTQNRQLNNVDHDARWSIALFFTADAAKTCDAFFAGNTVERSVNDEIIHMLCYQSKKTQQAGGPESHAGCVLVAHTTVEWAQANLKANGRDRRLFMQVAEHVRDVMGFKAPLKSLLRQSKVITWKQCQVTSPIAMQDSAPCLLVSKAPPLLLAGDYFTESSFGGCLKSGFAAAEELAGQFQ
mmetsp:Transcript_30620/g.60072  ORF Transcript_30620/g.60072 Transcript_30620/m.60072 type:complete len:431 (-) Transcript_30620:180-1472(-)